jgi:hypothetical protein
MYYTIGGFKGRLQSLNFQEKFRHHVLPSIPLKYWERQVPGTEQQELYSIPKASQSPHPKTRQNHDKSPKKQFLRTVENMTFDSQLGWKGKRITRRRNLILPPQRWIPSGVQRSGLGWTGGVYRHSK